MQILITWIISAIVMALTAYILPGVIVEDIFAALATAFVLGLLNAFVRPLLIFFTLPLTIITLGLFTLVINAGLVLLASFIVPGFEVSSFWWALLFSIIVSLTTSLTYKMTHE